MEQQRFQGDGVVVAVVEDDPLILDAVKLVLEAQGWEARAFATGEDFLADYRERPRCDCLLLDPHLPGIDGRMVAEALAGSQVPILVITAHPDSPLTRAVLRSGARALITKPVGAVELVQRIEQLLPRPAEA